MLPLDEYPEFQRKGKDIEKALDIQSRYNGLIRLAKEKGYYQSISQSTTRNGIRSLWYGMYFY